jgi:hypothetical protein
MSERSITLSKVNNQTIKSRGNAPALSLTKSQRQFPDEWYDEMSRESDEVGTEPGKQFAEFVCFRSKTCKCSSAEDAVREDA